MDKPEPLSAFKPLSEYKVPNAPARETVRRKFVRFWRAFRPTEAEESRPDDLKTAGDEILDEVAARPDVGPLVDILQSNLTEWLGTTQPKRWVTTIVLPPCEEFGIVEKWAEQNGFEVAPEPTAEEILRADLRCLPEMKGDRPLVIPRLERWVLRHHHGLQLVRELLMRLDSIERHCVVGCNSWAWLWLSEVADASARLPAPLTPAAFDGERLGRWFHELADRSEKNDVVFRRSDNGQRILSKTDAATASANDYLKSLAAVSRGIPWVAWQLWRQSMRTGPDDASEAKLAEKNSRSCIWMKPLADVGLPKFSGNSHSVALFVLQALLLHGRLSLDLLRKVLPSLDAFAALHRLEEEGFVVREEGEYRVRSAGYPAARESLLHAGFPLDAL
ncbi:MAG: hypothetical protein ABI992_05295 [Chthoniobacterales bacterium]